MLAPYCPNTTMMNMGSGVFWKITVTQHSPPLHQQIQLEIVMQSLLINCINFAQKHRRVELRAEMARKTEKCRKYSLVRRVHISACFWKKTDVGFYMPKRTIQTVTNEKCKKQSL